MNAETIVLINIVAFCVFSIALSVVQPAPGRAMWIVANVLVLAIAGVLTWTESPHVLWVTLSVFVPFIALPVVFMLIARRYAGSADMTAAARWMGRAGMLAPSASNRFQVRLLEALALPDPEAAAAALSALEKDAPDEGSHALVIGHQARMRDDWDELARMARTTSRLPVDLLPFAVRALGEVGATADMVRFYSDNRARARSDAVGALDLFVLAFTGRVRGVQTLLEGPLAGLDAETRQMWRLIARLKADAADAEARLGLEDMAARGKKSITQRTARRHAASSYGWEPLTPEADAIVEACASRVLEKQSARPRSWRDVPATALLLSAIAVMYAASVVAGGSQDVDVLVWLGAVNAEDVVDGGAWWRLIAALFLHFGIVHVLVNGFILALVGSAVETRYGWRAVAVAFFAGGVASMFVVVFLMTRGVVTHGVLVGASGAIFALIGFEGARRFRAWQNSRDPFDRREMYALAAAVSVQAAIDLSIPEISFTAHASGFVAGIALGLGWRGAGPAR